MTETKTGSSQAYVVYRPSYFSQCKALTQARKEYPELNAAHVHVLQQTLNRLENAFVAMWDKGQGFPRFKSTKRMRSFVYPQLGVKPLKENAVKLPKIVWVKMRVSRLIPEGFELKDEQEEKG